MNVNRLNGYKRNGRHNSLNWTRLGPDIEITQYRVVLKLLQSNRLFFIVWGEIKRS